MSSASPTSYRTRVDAGCHGARALLFPAPRRGAGILGWERSALMAARRLIQKPFVQRVLGVLAAEYLRLVWKTSRFVMEPADAYDRLSGAQPVIVAFWHGQHFMVPFLRRRHDRVKVLISRHRDGEINAIAAERLGIGTIRGSGDHGGRFGQKGGVPAFKSMLSTLEEGCNMALTADVPKVSRVCGMGIIMLARASGRPVFPVAFTTSRKIVLDNWDRSAINLPFSRGAIIVGEPIRVPAGADPQALESARINLQAALNAMAERADEVVNRRSS